MKIVEVEAVHLRLPDVDADRCDGTQDTLLIFVRTDDGLTGVGEVDSSPEVAKAVVEARPSHLTARGLRSVLIGTDPLQIERRWQDMVAATRYLGPGGPAMHAISGVDVALWDIAAQAYGVPLVTLLGGATSDRLRAYASQVMPDTPAQAADAAAEYAAAGYRAVKFGWGPLGDNLAVNEALISVIRSAVGDDVEVMIDGGQVWDLSAAVRMAEICAAYGVGWLEEPLPPDDLAGYAELARRSPVPIAGGEQESTYPAFERLVCDGGVQIVQPDLGRCGGLTQGRRIAWLAQTRHRRVVPHAFKSGVLVAASTHFAAAISNGGLIEHTVSTSSIARDLVQRPVHFENGQVVVPTDRPGLGVEIDSTVLNRLRVEG